MTSTCTLWAYSACASAVPRSMTAAKYSSKATSHSTVTRSVPIPPSSRNGSGASRVHSSTESGIGSPEATPRVKGSLVIRAASRSRAATAPRAGRLVAKASAAVAAVTVRKRLRPRCRAAARSTASCGENACSASAL